jgi:hypothetical protein
MLNKLTNEHSGDGGGYIGCHKKIWSGGAQQQQQQMAAVLTELIKQFV